MKKLTRHLEFLKERTTQFWENYSSNKTYQRAYIKGKKNTNLILSKVSVWYQMPKIRLTWIRNDTITILHAYMELKTYGRYGNWDNLLPKKKWPNLVPVTLSISRILNQTRQNAINYNVIFSKDDVDQGSWFKINFLKQAGENEMLISNSESEHPSRLKKSLNKRVKKTL